MICFYLGFVCPVIAAVSLFVAVITFIILFVAGITFFILHPVLQFASVFLSGVFLPKCRVEEFLLPR